MGFCKNPLDKLNKVCYNKDTKRKGIKKNESNWLSLVY